MLTISNVSKSFGARTLFDDVSLTVNVGDRLALVGANGAGKSTLFSIILKNAEPDEGTVVFDRGSTLGYLPQETAVTTDETVLELATAITPEHSELRRILNEGDRTGHTDTEEYHAAQGRYAELGGYQLDPVAKRILKGLAFRETDFDRQARTMSGGWIMRAHLARLLVMEPTLLMLDEPTNHLDLESLEWFQTYLQSYPGAILMISHDRTFLNALVDGILEIRNSRLHKYRGNYDDYQVERSAREAQQLAAYQNQQDEIDKLQRFADRFRAKASKAAQAQSKLKQIERMDIIEAPETNDKRVKIRFPQPQRSGQRVMVLEKVHFGYDTQPIYKGIDFVAERGERLVLVGPNGAGKSTLLKILAGQLKPQSGTRTLGYNAQVGYFSQNRVEMLDPTRTVLDEVMSIANPVPEVQARTVLGSFLFTGDSVFKKTSVLSGGEKSRLALVKLLLNPPNLLLMDEPTTHLDIASIDALVDALNQYEGALIFISHDVHFIRTLAKTVLHISAGVPTPYAGDYAYYLEKTRATSERAALVAGDKLTNSRPAEEVVVEKPKVSVFKTKEQKRREAEERQARSAERKKAGSEVALLEKEIAAMEKRQSEITSELAKPETYADNALFLRLNREHATNESALEKLNEAWAKESERVAAEAKA